MANLRPNPHTVPSTEYYQKKAEGTFISAKRAKDDQTAQDRIVRSRMGCDDGLCDPMRDK